MTTPKCPLCGTPLKPIRGYDVQGITTDWVAGCYNCFFQSSHFWKTKKACLEDMDRLVSLFPIAARLHYHDELYVDGHSEPVKFIAIQPNTTSLLLVEGSDGKLFWTADHNVDKWPWEEYPGRIYRKEAGND